MKAPGNLTLTVLAIAISPVHAQTQVDLRTQSKMVDFSSALSTKTSRTGTALPATCSMGETFFKTNATAGQNLYGCTATNAWTVLAGSASSSTNATQLQSRNFAATAPLDGQAVVWNVAGNTWQPATLATGGGGGGTSFGRFNISGTGAASLDFGTDCATYTCSAGPINNPTTYATPMTISSISGATSAVIGLDLSVTPARGEVVLDAGSATVSGMSGVAVVGAIPANMFVFYTCNISAGVFASCADKRGFTGAPPVTGHGGVICTAAGGASDCILDSAQVPKLSAVPGSSAGACSPPQFAADANFYYICVGVNTWRRVAVSAF